MPQIIDSLFLAAVNGRSYAALQALRRNSGNIAYEFATGVWTDQSYDNPGWLNSLAGAKVTGLATVATSGAYTDLSGAPSLGTLASLNAAPAGTLTGTTLAANVVTSSLTAVGTLSAGSIPYSLVTGGPTAVNGADPTGTVGLSAINGSAATFLRSDGAPALSQAITPTWTGAHAWAAAADATCPLTVGGHSDTQSAPHQRWSDSAGNVLMDLAQSNTISGVNRGKLTLYYRASGTGVGGSSNTLLLDPLNNLSGAYLTMTPASGVTGKLGVHNSWGHYFAFNGSGSVVGTNSVLRPGDGTGVANDDVVALGSATNRYAASYFTGLGIYVNTAVSIGAEVRGTTSQTGALVLLSGKSSTTAGRPQAEVDTAWNAIDGAGGTDATRSADLILRAYTVTTAQEGVRVRATVAGVRLGFFGHAAAAQPAAYTPTNVTVDRSYDANSTTIDEIADVLGTLITDLQTMGIIG